MSCAAMGTSVRLEVRRSMQSASLILGGMEGRRFPVDVFVSPSSLQIQTPEGSERISLPAEVTLVPTSCRYLQLIPGEGLHVRLQVQAERNTGIVPKLNELVKVDQKCSFYCQSCGELIIREQLFLRVLPLPSENWSSLVEEWCCHPDPFANRCCLPKVNDFFLGDTLFLVNRENLSASPGDTNEESSVPHSVDANVSKPKENTKVICKRCNAILGELVSSDAVKYYITEVMIQPSCQEFNIIPRARFVERIIVQLLMEFSTSRSTFRFCIEGQDGKHFLLLWLINIDTLLVESARPLGKDSSSFSSKNTSHLSPGSTEARNVVRVLYTPCTESKNKELVDKWINDTGAQALTFPNNTCLELVLLLCLNNRSLPQSLRFMNNWQVAYLNV